jgi:hypothetical protein
MISDDLRQQFQVAAQEYCDRPVLQQKWAESLTDSELAQIAEGEYSTRVVVHDAMGEWSYDAPDTAFAQLREVCRAVHAQRHPIR